MNASNAGACVDMMFRAFSDRTRQRILHVLLNGEMCVGDIVSILDLPQPRVSRHLAYLRKSGLVDVRKSGVWNYYSLAVVDSPFHEKILSCISECFSEVPELQADDARAEKLKEAGSCCSYEPCLGRRCA